MDKVCCIILNYNDAPTIMSLVDEIGECNCPDSTVVVDDCSTDGSWKQLKALRDLGKAHMLRTEENGSHRNRNQAGIDYAVTHLEAEYVIIANPDIYVRACCIERVKLTLDRISEAVMTSARMMSPEGGDLFSYWTLLPMWKDLLDTDLITRCLLKPMLNTPAYRLKEGGDEGCHLVDIVFGSFSMLKLGLFMPQGVKELFDKYMFLYYKEKVSGQKSKEMDLKTPSITDASYVHIHFATIDRSVKRIVDKRKLLYKSKRYYYREYLHETPTQMAAARVLQSLMLAEVRLLIVVCRMR